MAGAQAALQSHFISRGDGAYAKQKPTQPNRLARQPTFMAQPRQTDNHKEKSSNYSTTQGDKIAD